MTTALSGADACSCFTVWTPAKRIIKFCFQNAKLVFALTDLKTCKGNRRSEREGRTESRGLDHNYTKMSSFHMSLIPGDKEAKLAAATRNKCLAKVRECNADVTKVKMLDFE